MRASPGRLAIGLNDESALASGLSGEVIECGALAEVFKTTAEIMVL